MFSVRGSLAWMMVSQSALFVLQFAASVIVARLLTPYDMGVFAVAASIAGLLSILRAMGLAGYIVRAVELTPTMLSTAFTINAILAVLVACIIVALSALGGALLNEPGVQQVLLVMAVLPLISIFEFLPAAAIERRGNFRAVAILGIVRSVIANAVTLAFALKGFSYMSLAYGQASATLVSAIGMSVIGRRDVRLRLGVTGWRDMIRYGLQMLAISGVNVLGGKMAELVLARLLGLSALGLFSRASGLTSMLWDNIHVLIARVVFVDFSEQRRRGLSLRSSYLRILQMVTALLWPAFAGLAVIAGPLIMALYGEAWVGAALPLSLLSVAAFIGVSVTMTWEVFVVSRETARQTRFEFIRAGVGFLLFVPGCLISINGAAASKIGESLFSMLLYRPHLQRMTDTSGADYVPIYRDSAILTVAAIFPACAVMTIFGWSPHAPLTVVLSAVVVGLLSWCVGLYILRHPIYDEALRLLSRFRAPRSLTAAD